VRCVTATGVGATASMLPLPMEPVATDRSKKSRQLLPPSDRRLLQQNRHFCDIAISRMDFRLRWKSGHAANITAMTEFDPERTSLRGVCIVLPPPNWGMDVAATPLIQNNSGAPVSQPMAGSALRQTDSGGGRS
jgi:hypothetical protein